MARSTLLSFCTALLIGACAPEGPSGPVENDPPLGDSQSAFFGTPDNGSVPYQLKADGTLPERHSELLAFASPVRNQGGRNVCTIFSTVALMEHLYIKAGWPSYDFSEQYLQWLVKFEDGVLPTSPLSSPAANLAAIYRHGIVPETLWPYETSPWSASDDPLCTGSDAPPQCHTNGQPPQAALETRTHYLPQAEPINTEAIKEHLYYKRTGVVVTLDFFFQSWNHRRSTLPINSDNWRQGIVLAPNAEDVAVSKPRGAAHSVLVLGWDDTLEIPLRDAEGNVQKDAAGNVVTERGFYIFKNSWGAESFGAENDFGPGYGYLSMRYVREHSSAMIAALPPGPEYRSLETRLSGGVTAGEMRYHSVELGPGAIDVRVTMTGSGDPDLYTRFDALPDESEYDCYDFVTGPKEQCIHATAKGQTLQIGVLGAAEGLSTYELKVEWRTR